MFLLSANKYGYLEMLIQGCLQGCQEGEAGVKNPMTLSLKGEQAYDLEPEGGTRNFDSCIGRQVPNCTSWLSTPLGYKPGSKVLINLILNLSKQYGFR